ncbi:MAG TPA: rhomboid family intramembrane serine protease [Pseudonocardia sp.]|nr:rhomboid family intramembrane serine protease [Pseudonocardia sp.]
MVTPVRPNRSRSASRVLPSRPFVAAATMLLFTLALYVIEAYDVSTGLALDDEEGIIAREPSHLDGVIFAPLLHHGWDHLASNTLPFLVFGFLAMAGGIAQFIAVTATVWLLSGIGVWLLAPPGSVTVGASGVIFGWLVFLLFRGFFARSMKQILLAVVLFFLWGGVLLGVLPGQPGISWQAHLFGALAGVLAASMVARADRRRRAGDVALPR